MNNIVGYNDNFSKTNDFEDASRWNIYYIRNWIENEELVYDVGSHTEFFYLVNDDGAPTTFNY